jgi:hypothetical protein
LFPPFERFGNCVIDFQCSKALTVPPPNNRNNGGN